MSQEKTVYKTFSTQYFKTHFAKLLREMNQKKFDAALITSNGRTVGIFLPYQDKK